MESLDRLDEQQRRTLSQYQSITRSHDIEEAVRILMGNNWNLEDAIQNKYHTTTHYEESVEDSHSTSASSSLLGSHRRSVEERGNRGILSLVLWPFTLIWKIIWGLYHIVVRLLYKPSIATTAPRRDPRSEADRFLRDFESTYGTIHPDFFEGSYTQALNVAKKELKYLVVILESEEHDDNDAFCRAVLTSPELIDFLRQNHAIVWGGNVRRTEAFQVSNILEATTYPFIAIIALQILSSNPLSPTLSVVDRIEGPTTSAAVIRRFQNAITRTEANMSRMRQEREIRERRAQEQDLRREQERAYDESLRIDREREKRMVRERQEAVMRERARLLEEKNRKLYIRYLCQKLKDTLDSDEKTIRISFRMADGSRVIRKFNGSDTLETLYQFAEAYPHMETCENGSPVDTIPEGYVHKYKFTLHSAYPRTVYQADSEKQIIDEKSLWPSATLIVDMDEEEEEEEEEDEE
ncbi:hypothetical protein G6F56_001605 [Rhizopus delemar]|uniref:UBX domain-containing protein n=1 Tax=Rhizopus stolonifer TaxID=4846 RepID=A0A367KDA2_RHIST|nr:hypothetical protein G6F56_001605 [Rhizopus delemar]RCH99811.1 hypothetical protein CU098_010360 [Rhizopus stolonifer]